MRRVLVTAAAVALMATAAHALSPQDMALATENGSKAAAVGLCEDWGQIRLD